MLCVVQVLYSGWFPVATILTTSHCSCLSPPVSVDPPGPLQEASQATLTCKVNGPSQSSTVEWKKPDGSKVQSKAVHLERVDVSHKGTWTCKVTYEGEKLDANINVQGRTFSIGE